MQVRPFGLQCDLPKIAAPVKILHYLQGAGKACAFSPTSATIAPTAGKRSIALATRPWFA